MTMTMTNAFREYHQRAIFETFDLWDIWSEWWENMTLPNKKSTTKTKTKTMIPSLLWILTLPDQTDGGWPNFTILEYLEYLEYLELGQFRNFCDVSSLMINIFYSISWIWKWRTFMNVGEHGFWKAAELTNVVISVLNVFHMFRMFKKIFSRCSFL